MKMKKITKLTTTLLLWVASTMVMGQNLTKPLLNETNDTTSYSITSQSKNSDKPIGGLEVSYVKPEKGWGLDFTVAGKYFFFGGTTLFGKTTDNIRDNNAWRIGLGANVRHYLSNNFYIEGRTGLYYAHTSYEYKAGTHEEPRYMLGGYRYITVTDWKKESEGDIAFAIKPTIGIDFSPKFGIFVGYDIMWAKLKFDSDHKSDFWTFGLSFNF